MAHFAELDENNVVVRVLVVDNVDITNRTGVEQESVGQAFLDGLLPGSGTWIQTSYNHNFRARFAGIGYTYDPDRDVFLTPQPFPSWTLDDDTEWLAPVPYPVESPLENPTGSNPPYLWDEATTSWVEVTT